MRKERDMKKLCLLALVLIVGSSAVTPASAKNIIETAAEAGTFTILLAAVKAAGMNDVFTAEGPLTVFAPTDDAFSKLPRGTLESLMKPDKAAELRTLLMHHLVIGRIPSRDILGKRMEAATADGALILIDATKGVSIDGAKLIKADIATDNGILHVIDTVLMPK